MKLATRLIVLLLSAFSARLAAAEVCGPPVTPEITVKVDEAPVQQDRSIGVTELTKIPTASRRTGMEAYGDTLGLTAADVGATADIDFLTTPDGSGGFCTQARHATITLRWRTTVHIAEEIKPGSCFDTVVSAHEQGHVDIDQRLIPIGRQAIELALMSVLRHGQHGASVTESQEILQGDARKALHQALDIFSVVRTREQLAHDSKEEYDKISDTCGILDYMRLMRDAHMKKAGS
jgi:hypothetical protein